MAKKTKVTDGQGDRYAVVHDPNDNVGFYDELAHALGLDVNGEVVATNKKGERIETRSTHCARDVAHALGAIDPRSGESKLKKGVYKITARRVAKTIKPYKAPRVRKSRPDDVGASAAAAESLG